MAVPKFFEFLPVVLFVLLDGHEKAVKDLRKESIAKLQVSEEDCNELLPSGKQRTVDNRVNWAITYLKNAGLIIAIRRGVYTITEEGKKAYADAGDKLDLTYLEKYESFRAFHAPTADCLPSTKLTDTPISDTPQDMFDKAYAQINAALSEELLSIIMEHSPQFFEQLVVDLLLKMGYGSSIETAGFVVGKSEN